MNKEELLDKLRKMLFTTQQANECGLSNNDFKEDIEALSGTIGLIEKQEKIINDIKFIAYNNKPHITQEKIIEYFKKVVDEDVKN